MPQELTEPAPLIFRSPGRHLLAGVLAVLLSVALHIGIVQVMPPLPVGRLPDVKTSRRAHPVELHEVQRLPLEPVSRPEVFRPTDPGAFARDVGVADLLDGALRDAVPVQPDPATGAVAGEDEPLVGPPDAERALRWEPREELLAVRDAWLPDEVAMLPRRYVEDTPRSTAVPDITLPTDWVGEAGLERLHETSPAKADTYAMLSPAGDRGSVAAPSDHLALPGGGPLTERLGLLDEVLEDVTPVQPVEQRLNLELFTFAPPDEPDAVYFKIHIRRKASESLPVVPKDVVLLQDCSESMTPAKLEQCKRGLHAWMDSLDEGDRFELIRFRNEVESCFGGWTNMTAGTRARANWFVRNMVARGRTDVYASLEAALSMHREPGRPVIAVLVTDGRPTMGLTDSSEIIESFTQSNGASLSVFAFGGGSRVNQYLLDYLSYKNRGDAMVVPRRNDIPDGLRQWASDLSRPVLTDLNVRFAGLSDAEVYPRTLTHLYLDRPLVLYGRAPRPLPKVAFQVLGFSGPHRYDMVFTLPWEEADTASPDLRSQWAWQRALFLVGEHIRTGEPAILGQVRAIEETYGLSVPYHRR